jgi:4-aminobutyrate aminotransferase-like enzyme
MKLKPVTLTEDEIEEMITEITDEEIKEAEEHSLTPLKDKVMFEGEPGGAVIRDLKGNEYIDCTSQAWTLNIGFCDPDIAYVAALQMQRLSHVRYGFPTVPRLKLLNELTKLFKMPRASFNNMGGGAAVEAAMKVAMLRKNGADTFITTWRAYHGASLGTLAASAYMPTATRFPGFGREHFVKVPYPYCYRCYLGHDREKEDCTGVCAEFVKQTIKHGVTGPVAGILLEPISGPGGHIEAHTEYLKALKEICEEIDALLIFDEAQTGFGRVGEWCASDLHNMRPDVMCLTKAIAGGVPMGAILTRGDIVGFTESEEHSTFGSNPVMFAASLVNIEIIKRKKLLQRSKILGERFKKGILELQEKYPIIGDVRCPGLYKGVELVEDPKTKTPAVEAANNFIEEGWKRGVIFDYNMPSMSPWGYDLRNVIKFKPPLTITEEQVDRVLEVFEECLQEVTK